MKTKTPYRTWLLILPIFFIGCMASLNPVYQEHQLVYDPDVIGQWAIANSDEQWEFMENDGESYRVLHTDREGVQDHYVAHLAKVDGVLLLDLFPEKSDLSETGLYQGHLVPIHTIYLVNQVEPQIVLATINYQTLDEYLTAHPDEVPFVTYNGNKLITGSTEEVQEFVMNHQDMFNGFIRLERSPK